MTDIHYSQTLYKTNSKGQVGSWAISVVGTDALAKMITMVTRVVGGKSSETVNTYDTGKNIGRANETTPLQQAIKEAQAKANKKLDAGYSVDMPEEGAVAKNSLGFEKPMLAQPVDKVKDWTLPAAVQPKFDGHRMLATLDKEQKVVLYSRQGKVLDVKHIADALQAAYDNSIWDGQTLDGEVYAHGFTLQQIASMVKKPKPESKNLVFCLYDIIDDEPYVDRFQTLKAITDVMDSDYLVMTTTYLMTDISELDGIHRKNIEQGYEGTMIRTGDAGYEQGKRSKGLLKKKDFMDEEFRIVGWETGKRNEQKDLDVGIFVCELPDGKSFSVTAPGDMYQKHQFAQEPEQYLDRMMTVRFFNYTPDGIPFHPVAKAIREDI